MVRTAVPEVPRLLQCQPGEFTLRRIDVLLLDDALHVLIRFRIPLLLL